uniref:LOB domain-containing protein n=1 Tax=Oryza brachyantha TaxID=4533 RepID=J3LRB7_ORYBR
MSASSSRPQFVSVYVLHKNDLSSATSTLLCFAGNSLFILQHIWLGKFLLMAMLLGTISVSVNGKKKKDIPVQHRGDAVSSLVYEANARVRDPIYGCVGAISSLQQQVEALQAQLALAQAEMVRLRMSNDYISRRLRPMLLLICLVLFLGLVANL